MGPLVVWYLQYARRLTAEAALADGWGEPVAWLRETAAYFAARGQEPVAAACRALLRRAGVPIPRAGRGETAVPANLRALGVTSREADVLALVADNLTSRELGVRLHLSPRTVESTWPACSPRPAAADAPSWLGTRRRYLGSRRNRRSGHPPEARPADRRAWCRRLLDADPVIDEDVPSLPGHHKGLHHTIFVLGSGFILSLHAHPATEGAHRFNEFRPGLDHIGFGSGDRGELQRLQDRLDELGIRHGGIAEDRLGYALSFRDPDDIALEFWAPRP